MNLQYKTRGMTKPQGKPRVYFACRQEDFETVFQPVSDDILRFANCSVWYADNQEEQADAGELSACLDEMQLVVLAVTSEMIHTPNRARDVILPYAYEHHIPILPIMMEPGLAREFNQATKIPIQVVNRIVNDPTATPYEDVLQTYLKSVLIGDETAERIRDAFDAYVFLSYRKKDRAHAQRLMRLIHQNDDFRDIAIWYDEYLIPGEEYNEDIKLAFAKSTLFAMAVTPSLEEKGNYVMRVEYPMARDREKEEDGFQIVPVEMYDHDNPKWRVDQSHLREFRYQNIEKLQDEHRETEMNQAFLDALENMARKKNDGSAQHRFFIGLAYLCGIDVEIDPARALAMISDAATDANPCLEATEKLVDMYLMGDGVPVSISSAVSWQETLCEQLKAEVNKNHSADEHLGFGTRYFRALLRLSDLQRETGNIPDAMARAEEALHVAEGLTDEVGKREVTRDTAVICTRIGSLLQTQGDYNNAKRYYARAERTYSILAGELGTTRARRDLSIAKERLGDAERKEGDTSSALQHYLAVLQIREELASRSDSLRAKRDLSVILTKLGTCYRNMKEAAEARRTFERAYEIDSKLAAEEQSALAWDDLTVSLVKLGDMEKEDKNLTSAAAYYQKAYDTVRPLAEHFRTLRYQRHYATSCEKLASVKKRLAPAEEVKPLFEEAVAVRWALSAKLDTPLTEHELAVSLFNYGAFLDDPAPVRQALEIWQNLCTQHPEYEKYRAKAEKALRSVL